MEYGMTRYPHCVVLERSVYVGGGYTGYDGDDEYYIQVFNMKTNNWSRLTRYRVQVVCYDCHQPPPHPRGWLACWCMVV